VTERGYHLVFILEEEYRESRLPRAVIDLLSLWGHRTTVVEPGRHAVAVDELAGGADVDAAVLRTVSGGPGLPLLRSLGAAGILTINDAEAVARARDKTVMHGLARVHHIAVPETFYLAHEGLLEQIPADRYPLVVKPAEGGFGQHVRIVSTLDEARGQSHDLDTRRPLVAQRWVPNSGYDVKLYNTGTRVHAVRRRSSLMGGGDRDRERIVVPADLAELARRIGAAFGLAIYGADVVEAESGWVVVDVNDFPSFGMIPEAPEEVASTIVDVIRRAQSRGTAA